MGMGQGVRAGLGYGGITCVLQTQFSRFFFFFFFCKFNFYFWKLVVKVFYMMGEP